MKKFALIIALTFGLVLATTSFASAKDMTGRFGIGADSNLGWSSGGSSTGLGSTYDTKGLSLVYYVSKMFGLQIIAGAQFKSASDDNDADYSFNAFGLAVRGLIPVALTNDVNLDAVVGFSFINSGWEEGPSSASADDSANMISFELGIRPEWFITDHFSVHTQVGIAFSLLDEDNSGRPDSGYSGFDMNIFANPDLLGQAGFTFYMN